MAGYECPHEVRGLEKLMTDFTYRNGLEITRVFDDWIRYIIHGYTFDIKETPPLSDWNYTKEQTLAFYNMYAEWMQVMSNQVRGDGEWYDAFGTLYEALIASKGRRDNAGQFFTPDHLCELTARNLTGSETVTGKKISDPTCGSGRMLLAFHVRNLGNTLYAEDIDRTCCMMTVCNFLIHGCVGEVVWHDSLWPETHFGAWRVNENLKFGFPSVRTIEKEQCYVWRMWQRLRIEHAQETPAVEAAPIMEPIAPAPANVARPVQLTLFD